jgi:hypothetical protein
MNINISSIFATIINPHHDFKQMLVQLNLLFIIYLLLLII